MTRAALGANSGIPGGSKQLTASLMGHSGPGVLQVYARAIDEYRRSAISKLEALREA
jgi:hypothetical protein